MNTTPHTSIFHSELHATRMDQVWVRTRSITSMLHAHLVVVSDFSLVNDSIFFSFLTVFSLLAPCPSFSPSTSSSTMWWTNSLRTSADEDLGTLAEYDPLTGYEPNDYHITEAYEHHTQESSVEQRSPNDFEHDDVTNGKALSDGVPKTSRSLSRRFGDPL